MQRRCAQIKGHLERNGRRVEGVRLFGRWHHSVHVAMPDGTQRQLWKANPPYKHACHRCLCLLAPLDTSEVFYL